MTAPVSAETMTDTTTAPASTVTIIDQNQISSFNRGPITSLFVPPSSCTATISSFSSWLFFGHFYEDYDPDCYPQVSGSTIPGYRLWGSYYYSPAICPADWTIATTFSDVVPVYPSPTVFALGSATTAALCCPSWVFILHVSHVEILISL
ncbi:hypothetical protein AG0111_0g7104 [Alternaria gaisen]|uniref:Uncharacterized protein n=1 Tax=Alternaria gaisen TaxID=167740 RepID=A0ACB6FL38_9PLEO|nr:hypothetical protein AG0111_0g7104 [Alternaria gaisen]